jgi:putative DNA primase/helicase
MQELFRGYLPTKDKTPLIKFKDAKPLSEVENLPEYAGLLAEDVILIDVDNYEQSEKLMNIVEDLQLNCRVYQTTRGKHFLFHGGKIEKCGTHLKLAVGIEADIKIGNRNSISVLKYDGKERKIIYDIEPDESYSECPYWLTPVKTKTDFNTLESGDGRNQELFNYILTLQSAELTNEEIKDTIRLLNKYVLPDSLEQSELDKILREDSFKKPTFYGKNGNFLFNKFATYLTNTFNIIKIDDQLHIYKEGVYVDGLHAIEKEMIKIIPTLTSRNRNEVIKYLYLIAPVVNRQSGANYIPFNNGIYNIETGQLEDFRPDVVVKNKIPHNYNYDAYNESMDTMLDRVSCNDDQIRDLLEEMAGYCMYRRNELRKAFILIGDKANGKSTYLDCITNMVGENNTCALDLKELGDRFRTAELFGKLINAGDDIGDEFIANPAVFKKLVSGDRVTVERKGQDPFDFCNYSKFIFSANNIPRIKDKTGAVLDRLVIVPFRANFSKNDANYDPYIKYKLREPEALEYLIQLGLDGLKRVLDHNGFTICQAVQNELEEYSENNNPIIGFLRELDVDVDILNQPTKDVYLRYKLYCNDNGFNPMSAGEFTKYIKKTYDLDNPTTRINGKVVRLFRRVE